MLAPPPPHLQRILGAAGQFEAIGNRYIAAFDNPNDFTKWLMDPAKADAYLVEIAGGAPLSGD